MNLDQETGRENIAAGLLGALLGSLAGVACILLVSQLNVVASVSGMVMAVCTLKGYEKLAGKLGKIGVAFCCVMIVGMTYLAHHLDVTLEVTREVGMSFGDVFCSIPKLLRLEVIDGAAFWGNLGMLYLFTVLGAAPILFGGFASTAPAPLPVAAVKEGDAQEAAQAEFFPPEKRLFGAAYTGGMIVATLFLVGGLVAFVWGSGVEGVSPLFVGILMMFSGIFLFVGPLALSQELSMVYVRTGGVLWRVDLRGLDLDDTRFTNQRAPLTAVRWPKLKPEEQERAKEAMLRAVAWQSDGQLITGDVRHTAVQALPDPVVERETKWAWKLSYAVEGGKRRRVTIHKIFSGFAPTPEQTPPERPLPMRWRGVCIALAVVLALGGLFVAVDITNARREDAARRAWEDENTASSASEAAEAAVTQENYRSLFHLDAEDGYAYIGMGYIPVPAEAFGENMFVPAYLPYCETPEYSDDGSTISAAAHGMRVEVTVTPAPGDARDAVDAMFAAFEAAGADLYEDGVYETEFSEEYGVAVKQVFYFEENHTLPRVCLFYADEPVNGHCYAARITYLLEQTDADYPALLAELGDVFGLTLPEIDPYTA